MKRIAILLALIPAYAFGFQRVIDLPVDVSTTSEVVADIEFYQAESVQLNLYVKRNGAKVTLDSDLDVVWRAWIDGTPGTLYINATGTVFNATAGHCRVNLTPAQANPTNATYKYTVQLYDGATYMGVGASGELVVRYAPQSGSVAYVGTTSYFTDTDTLGDLTPTAGRLVYGTGTAWATLAAGTSGQVLTAQGAAAPVWSSAVAGDITGVAAGTGFSGGGTSGDVTLALANTAVTAGSYGPITATVDAQGRLTAAATSSSAAIQSALGSVYLPLAGGTLTGTLNGISANFTDTVDTSIINVSNIAVNVLGSITKDGSEYWHPTNDGAGSGLDADLLDGQHGAYYLNLANATNTLADARLSTAARTLAFSASAWEGPTASQTPGWAPKSYAVAGLNAVVAGPVGSATQAAGTFSSIFQMPSDATAWRSAKAISLSFIGDSTTSTAVKYRLRVYIAGNNTALYDVSDQVLASTTTVTTVDIAGSSLATFTADAVYTIVVDASVTTSGFYFVGQPRIQVLK